MSFDKNDIKWMQFALRLSLLSQGKTAPNPMVGAVLVYQSKIIGQGWHKQYGEAHAEVNCLNSVSKENQDKIPESTLYVSLEPCNHYGQTPPCSLLLLESKVKKVVIATTDPFEKVNGSGVQRLKEAGIEVTLACLEREARYTNRHFFTFHLKKRPFITLKWAESLDGKIGSGHEERWLISNALSKRWVHQLRGFHQAILVGAQTVNLDLPLLDNRYFPGLPAPIKIVLDRKGIVNPEAPLFHQGNQVFLFTAKSTLQEKFSENNRVKVILSPEASPISFILNQCYQSNIQSILIEGGQKVLQEWIDSNTWDEAWKIQSRQTFSEAGIAAPKLTHAVLKEQFDLDSNTMLKFAPSDGSNI